ncbi:hypothetical protein Tco_1353077 [Tanacetum coccineum]
MVKGQVVVLDPFQMVLFKLKLNFKKWETILSENIISPSGNKDHLNACLSYMLYCLNIQNKINLAYYIAKRIESVTKSDVMTLSYGMLLTRLYKHGRALRIKPDGKRPHPQTPSESSRSPSLAQNQENDMVNNYTLDPIVYTDQLPPIEGGESPEFK